jgi:hypothetical protein
MRNRDGYFVNFCTLTPFSLSMRSAANVSQQLRRFDRAKANAKLPMELQSLLKEAWDAQS